MAVVGGDTLLAREIRELLDESKPAPRVQLISAAADGAALLDADQDEAVVMTPLAASSADLPGGRVAPALVFGETRIPSPLFALLPGLAELYRAAPFGLVFLLINK